MAVKGNFRDHTNFDHSIYGSEAAEAGLVLVLKGGGTGVANGDSAREGEVVADPAGKYVLGVLFNDIVDIDITRYALDRARGETQIGEKCVVIKEGYVVTDKIKSGSGLTAGMTAVLDANGEIADAPVSWDPSDNPHIGSFETAIDSDGFARVRINPANDHIITTA